MSYEAIIYDVSDGVATITLNRPETRNALNQAMYRDLIRALRSSERDEAVRAIIITGNGKGFCSGQDLVELEELRSSGISVGDSLRTGLNVIAHTIRTLEKPVIGLLNGVAAGAGASLALATDIRLASEDASLVLASFINIGIIPDGGSTYFLAELVGVNKALELSLLADAQNRVSAQQAVELGLVMRVVPAEQLQAEGRALALKFASMATRAIGMTKRAIYNAPTRSLAEALEYEAQVQTGAFRTEDFREGVQAFIEKRAPQFKGR